MSGPVADRWEHAQVLALAPDASSQRAARPLASARSWPLTGKEPGAVWGECRGSAATPYRAVVDLPGPAYKCSCPSRKFPCKHVLALLLLWADGEVPDGVPPEWAASWLAGRAAKAGAAVKEPAGPKDPKTALKRAEEREQRAAAGLAELDRWLCDQVRQGLAASQGAGYRHWDDIAARMVDAQAPRLAERLRALAAVPHSGPGWDGRLLEEYALLRLLVTAFRGELPAPLLATVRSRVGFTARQADVLAGGQPVRDLWHVLGRRDTEQDRIRTRRTWLLGRETGRFALVLSFAAAGATLDGSLIPGTQADAELVFYPGAVPLRALVLARHGTVRGGAPPGGTVAALLAGYAEALAGDPWLEAWPALLDAAPARGGPGPPLLRDADGDALPLHPDAGECWPLFALSGGRPLTVAGEWTPRGLWPLTAWDSGRVVPL